MNKIQITNETISVNLHKIKTNCDKCGNDIISYAKLGKTNKISKYLIKNHYECAGIRCCKKCYIPLNKSFAWTRQKYRESLSGFMFDGELLTVKNKDDFMLKYLQISEVQNFYKNCPYEIFLKSNYWQIVRGEKLKDKSFCEYCGTDNDLQVHHKSYENRGMEIYHLEDLSVLCKSCHKGEHKK